MLESKPYQPLPICFNSEEFVFHYSPEAFGPESEIRKLKDIRKSLMDPTVDGPEKLYAISMDVGMVKDQSKLLNSNLLFGVVGYTSGKIGDEPVRSQGHIHSKSLKTDVSPPEIFEIWEGNAIIYLQKCVDNDPGECYAVKAKPRDIVVCPPGWGHMVINADTHSPMVFGAMCDRSYTGFDYVKTRKYNGLAHYPLCNDQNEIVWKQNLNYNRSSLVEKEPEQYWFSSFISESGLYQSVIENLDHFKWIHDARLVSEKWETFIP